MKLLLSPDAAVATGNPATAGSGAKEISAAKPAAAQSTSTPTTEVKVEKPATDTPARKPGMFDELDAIMPDERPKPEPKKPDAKAAEPKADPEKPTADPAADGADKGKSGKVVESSLVKHLRTRGDNFESENKQLKSRIAELEKSGQSSPDAKALTERVATLEKQLAERENELFAIDVRKSPEFKKQFEEPFDRAAGLAERQIKQLLVTMTDAEGNKTTRAGSLDDLKGLYKMDLGKAIEAAHAMFGSSAQVVVNHIAELQRLEDQRQAALADADRTAAEKRKAKEAEKAAEEAKARTESGKARELRNTLWAEINKDIANRPENQVDPKDPKEKEILDKAFAKIDMAFGNREGETVEDATLLDAEVRNRAAREPLLRYRIKKMNAEIEELKGVIEEMKGGTAGNTLHPGGQQVGATAKRITQELDEADFGE